MNEVIQPIPREIIVTDDMHSRIKEILHEGTAENTIKAYQGDTDYIVAWARISVGYDVGFPFPIPLVVRFIIDHLKGMDEQTDRKLMEEGYKKHPGPHSLNTICRRIASLSAAHEAQGLENPCHSKEVKTLLSKARKAAVKNGDVPDKKKALTKDLLELLLSTCGNSLIDIRDRALLLFGFASGGRRRSELSTVRVEDLSPVEGGYIYHLSRSKTDQEGNGADYPVLGLAAIALEAWLEQSKITEGYLFRSISKGGRIGHSLTDKAINQIVKKRASLAGLDPEQFGAHSLRSGFITEAGKQGKALGDTMALSGHRSVRVAMGYYQAGNVINNPAALLLG